MRTFCCLVAVQLMLVSQVSAAKIAEAVQSAAKDGKYTYLMFYRENDAATRQMAAVIDRQVSRTSDRTN